MTTRPPIVTTASDPSADPHAFSSAFRHETPAWMDASAILRSIDRDVWAVETPLRFTGCKSDDGWLDSRDLLVRSRARLADGL